MLTEKEELETALYKLQEPKKRRIRPSTRKVKRSIDANELFEIVETSIQDQGLQTSRTFRRDFFENFSDLPEIDSFLRVKQEICERLRRILASDEKMNNKYASLVKAVSDTVRLRIGLILGFEESVSRPSKGGCRPARELLRDFLLQLPEGKPWSVKELKDWKCGDDTGYELYFRIYNKVGWSIDSVKTIIGDESGDLLMRNPFERKLTKKINGLEDARRYLTEFLRSLLEGKTWSVIDLTTWNNEEMSGETLRAWIGNHYENFNLSNIRKILGKNAFKILERNPFKPVWEIRSRADAKRRLIQYLETISEGQAWTPSTLQKWSNADGSGGAALYSWIDRNMSNGFNTENVRDLLGSHADTVLVRNPLEHREEKIKTIEDAKRYLIEFLKSLSEGERWTPARLINWKGNVVGATLYLYIRKHVRHNDVVDWVYVLVNLIPPEYLTRNPFYARDVGSIAARKIPSQDRRPVITSRKEIVRKATTDDFVFIGSPEYTLTPEQLVLDAEESGALAVGKKKLDGLIAKLTQPERELVQAFYREEDVDEDALQRVIGKMRKLASEM